MVSDRLFGLAERVAVTAGARAVDKDEGGWEFARRMLPLLPLTLGFIRSAGGAALPKSTRLGRSGVPPFENREGWGSLAFLLASADWVSAVRLSAFSRCGKHPKYLAG